MIPIVRRNAIAKVQSSGPSEFFKDLFTDAAGTLISAHTPDVGGTWVRLAGANDIRLDGSGHIYSNDVGRGYAYNDVTPPSADYYFEADFARASFVLWDAAITFRGDPTGGNRDWYELRYDGLIGSPNKTFKLLVVQAGVVTATLGTFAYNLDAGPATVKGRITGVGDHITVDIAGVTQIDVHDATHTTPGRPGISFNTTALSANTGVELANLSAVG